MTRLEELYDYLDTCHKEADYEAECSRLEALLAEVDESAEAVDPFYRIYYGDWLAAKYNLSACRLKIDEYLLKEWWSD